MEGRGGCRGNDCLSEAGLAEGADRDRRSRESILQVSL